MTAVLEKRDVLEGIAAPKPITSAAQNERYTAALLELEHRDHLTHTERELAEILTLLIEAYEDEHYPIPAASPIDILTELMVANDLNQKDLATVLGRPESTVSMILSGERKLSVHHIEKLSRRFNISPAAFFESYSHG